MARAGMSVKDSNVCLSLDCDCGAWGHHHGYFAHTVVCGRCGKAYRVEVKAELTPVELTPSDYVLLSDETIEKINRLQATGEITPVPLDGEIGHNWRDVAVAVAASLLPENGGES